MHTMQLCELSTYLADLALGVSQIFLAGCCNLH